MKLDGVEQAFGHRFLDLVLEFVDKHADPRHERRQRMADVRRLGHRDRAGAVRHENKPERVCPGRDRRAGVVQVGDPANLDSCALVHGHPINSVTLARISPLRIKDSPTRIAPAPAAASRSTSARP